MLGLPPSWFDIAGPELAAREEAMARTAEVKWRPCAGGSVIYANEEHATVVALWLIDAFPGRFLWIVFLDGRYPTLVTA